MEGQQGAYQWRCASQEVITFSLFYRAAVPCPNLILEFKETLDHAVATGLAFLIESAFDRDVPIRFPRLRVTSDFCLEPDIPTLEVYHATMDSNKTLVLVFIILCSGAIE